jgi:hypothetical protein
MSSLNHQNEDRCLIINSQYGDLLRFDCNLQSNLETAPLYLPQPLHCAHGSLGTEIPYVISKGISR